MKRPYKRFMKMGALALLCLLGACSDEAGVTHPDGLGVVNLRLTRASSSDPANEHVKTLRVIIADQSNTIYYNKFYSDIAQEDATWSDTFHDLPAAAGGTPYNFYAIANESSFLAAGQSLEGTDASILSTINDYTLVKEFGNGEDIPQTVKSTEPVSSGTAENVVNLQLQYAVAKVNLTFVNASGEEQSVSNISISGIKGASAPLFAPETVMAEGNALSFDNVLALPAGEQYVSSAYVYETSSVDGYMLTADYGGTSRTLKLNNLTTIPRGMQVNITVTLRGGALYATWTVTDWDDREMSYDMSNNGAFEIAAATVRMFDTNSLATVYSQSAGAADEQLTFTVRMTAPEGVRWIAHLTNPADFEFAGDYQGVGGEQAQPVTVTVRPTKAAATMDSRRETELYFTIDTNRDAEQNFNASPLGLGDNVQRVRIVQVTSAEWNNLQTP